MAKKPKQPPAKTDGLPPDEAALFEEALKGTKRLERKLATPEELGLSKKRAIQIERPDETGAKPRAAQAPLRSPVTKRTELPELETGATPGVDKRTAQRLKRGKMPIDGRIDLHGMTQDQAHGALNRFLASSQSRGRRCVIVITGKGYKSKTDEGPYREQVGVLKQAVPRWLNEEPNRARVLSFTQALQQDGGTGALYVYLKRLK